MIEVRSSRFSCEAEGVVELRAWCVVRQCRNVPVAIGTLSWLAIEGESVANPNAREGVVVALNRGCIGAGVVPTNPNKCAPAPTPGCFPFGEGIYFLSSTIIDVPEVVRRHASGSPYGWPPVKKRIVLIIGSGTESVRFSQKDVRLETRAAVSPLGNHRHTGTVRVSVRSHVHLVVSGLIERPNVQVTPLELAPITQDSDPIVVLDHIHALIGEPL